MTVKYKCLYEITGCIEDVNTFLVPLQDLPKQEQGEPVAYQQLFDAIAAAAKTPYEGAVGISVAAFEKAIGSKLYTTPQQRKPLTDEQIFAIGKELGLKCRLGGNPNIDIDYARAIEAAHGIKE